LDEAPHPAKCEELKTDRFTHKEINVTRILQYIYCIF